MGTYYNKDSVTKYGKRLSYNATNRLAPIFKNNLVAVCDKAISKFAADVSDADEFKHFRRQYLDGYLLSFILYDYDTDYE